MLNVFIIIFSGNTIGVIVTSSKIADISAKADIYLNLVLNNGIVYSNVLTHCGSLLTGMVTIPNVVFQYQLQGSDSEGNRFKTDVDVMVKDVIKKDKDGLPLGKIKKYCH